MIFTPQQRLTITRRQLNIQVENAGYARTNQALIEQQNKLLQVDNANAVFYDFFNTQAVSYENEARWIDGKVSNEYNFSDLDNAAQNNTSSPFFPSAENYIRFIPLIQEGVYNNPQIRGRFYPISTDARYENNILVNSVSTAGLVSAIQYLTDPIAGPSGTFTTATAIPAGTIVNETIDIVSPVQPYSVGDIILIYHPSGSGLYEVTIAFSPSGPLSPIAISSIIPTQTGINSGASVIQNVPAFSASERETMTHPDYNEYLNNVGALIISLVTEWQAKVTAQSSALNNQNDDRTLQSGQNTTAQANISNLLIYLVSWLALPYSGVTGKFTIAAITALSNQITVRLAYLPTRITQIEYALGQSIADALYQSGDNFGTNIAGNSYYQRYFWINVRINKLSGSLRRYYKAIKDQDQINNLAQNNIDLEEQYDMYFTTKRLMFSDETSIFQVDNFQGLAAGDIIYLVSETQPELEFGIVQLMGTNQIKVDRPIPNSYTKDDIARIFKLL